MATHHPDIRIFLDLDALSLAAATLFTESAAQATAQRGRCLVALSGGTTPAGLYALLAKSPFSDQIDWPHLHVFWADERCVAPDHPESNYRQANDLLLSQVPIPSGNIHRVLGESKPVDAALAYALTLQDFATSPLNYPRFDLVLLGMGEDGHTASLFPGSELDLPGPTAAVTAQYQGRPSSRVTLTPMVLNASRRAVFLVSGESKSQTAVNVLKGSYRPALLPAQRVRPTDGELIWLLDRTAARWL